MRVMQIGLGSIGCAVSRLLVQKSGWQIVAAVDADPAKQGRDLGEIVGLGQRLGVTVTSDLAALQDSHVDLAFLTTVSTFPEVLPTLSTLIQHHIDVVASTEELFIHTIVMLNRHWPWMSWRSSTVCLSWGQGLIQVL